MQITLGRRILNASTHTVPQIELDACECGPDGDLGAPIHPDRDILVRRTARQPLLEFGKMDEGTRLEFATSCKAATEMLNKAIHVGLINPSAVESIYDFGAGIGGPTLALKQVFPEAADTLRAAETMEIYRDSIVRNGILPKKNIESGDGIEDLKSRKNQYDLVTAFMYMDDRLDRNALLAHYMAQSTGDKRWLYSPRLSRISEFLDTALSALKPGGKLLLCSDSETTKQLVAACRGHQLALTRLPGSWQFHHGECGEALVLSK